MPVNNREICSVGPSMRTTEFYIARETFAQLFLGFCAGLQPAPVIINLRGCTSPLYKRYAKYKENKMITSEAIKIKGLSLKAK